MSLLDLPTELLRHRMLCDGYLDRCSLLMSRMVCRKLAQLVPPRCPADLCLDLLAARAGHLRLLKKLHVMRPLLSPLRSREMVLAAAASGNVDLIAWLLLKQVPWCSRAPRVAAKSGHLHVVMLAVSMQLPMDSDVCYSAAKWGHLCILEWLQQNAHRIRFLYVRHDPRRCRAAAAAGAARAGRLELVQLLHAQGWPYENYIVCSKAARGGHSGVLLWLNKHGSAWEARTRNIAAVDDYHQWSPLPAVQVSPAAVSQEPQHKCAEPESSCSTASCWMRLLGAATCLRWGGGTVCEDSSALLAGS
jgi:hypothetical protein